VPAYLNLPYYAFGWRRCVPGLYLEDQSDSIETGSAQPDVAAARRVRAEFARRRSGGTILPVLCLVVVDSVCSTTTINATVCQ
jgi:hypothetical protein